MDAMTTKINAAKGALTGLQDVLKSGSDQIEMGKQQISMGGLGAAELSEPMKSTDALEAKLKQAQRVAMKIGETGTTPLKTSK